MIVRGTSAARAGKGELTFGFRPAGDAVASRQQSAEVGEVSNAIAEMDGVTQKNAQLLQRATHSALALEAQSQQLAGAVSRFRIRQAASQSR